MKRTGGRGGQRIWEYMRRILRDFLARHEETTSDPLALRAAELLGFNLEPAQPVFPRWPQAGEGGVE